MPILVPLEFVCDQCGVTLRMPMAPGITAKDLPARAVTEIPRVPPDWTITDEGRTLCPPHKPQQLVQPVASLRDLGFKVVDGGRRS